MPESMKKAIAEFWGEATRIWSGGGWAMWAIAVIAIVMFAMGVHVFLRLRRTGFKEYPESTWRYWIDFPDQRRGRIGALLDQVAGAPTAKENANYFEQMRISETLPFERDLRVMKICVSAAPLVGLLGTVTGMLSTFGGLSSGGGGDKTMGVVAAGISEALITTETGLVIALPGLFFQYFLSRSYDRYKTFLSQLQTACTQSLHYRLKREAELRAAARGLTIQQAGIAS